LNSLFYDLGNSAKIEKIEIDSTIENIFYNHKNRFYILCQQRGFYRTVGNTLKETIIITGMRFLSFGIKAVSMGIIDITPNTPINSSSYLSVAIYDKKQSKFIYYDNNYAVSNPKEKSTIKYQLAEIYEQTTIRIVNQ